MTAKLQHWPTGLARVLYEQGRKQVWLAEQIGAHPVEVSKWAAGVVTPVVETQAKIAATLGVPAKDLFNERISK